MADFLPYGAQWIDADDVEAVVECLRSDYLTTGPRVGEFERAVCTAVGATHGVACSSGTAGLHAAAHVLDLGPDDEVVVPAVTFLATANCIHYCGARVVFCDVDPESGLMRPEDLEAVLTGRTRAVFPVHLTGRPVDLDRLASIACEAGLRIVEDAAHALGATLGGHRIGDGTRSVMTVFSFHPVKHITTGEGGLVTTADDELARRLRRFVSHGMERDAAHLERDSEGPWYYEQQELGFNYRITDIQCALGLSQMAKLERFVARRRELAAHYDRLLTEVPHVRPVAGSVPEAQSAYHLYEVLVDFDAAGTTRAELMGRLRERGIGSQVHYIPVPHQPYWRRAGYGLEDLPGAAAFYERTLSLPLFPRMADGDVERVVDGLRELLR
ncbi:MAG: UDP-4-amino-4,6-dideoxy-N-acetyl-beta-L-altrosamine transaminase [Planctomycetota bacterium]